MIPIEYILLVASVLVLMSILIARFSQNVGVPTVLVFLALGMFAGSEGPGGIFFDDAELAQAIGIIALVIILFAGGLDTRWNDVKDVRWHAAGLSTAGVILTTVLVGVFVWQVAGFPLMDGLLVGAILSATDAAAVLSVLRTQRISLRRGLKPLLELESGSNDPMAVFLTITLTQLIAEGRGFSTGLVWTFLVQMSLGAGLGWGAGRLLVWVANRIRLSFDGLYPVLFLAYAPFTYGLTTMLGGNGFLAVYIAGIVAGNGGFVQMKSTVRFFDGLSWLSQIVVFVTLGLLVFPSRLITVTWVGVGIALFLMLVARPVSVFLTLIRSRFDWRDKAFISWVGLRGAVPIILATFPLLAGLPNASGYFDVVFFVVLLSALVQGWSLPLAANKLGVTVPYHPQRHHPIDFEKIPSLDTDLVDLIVPYGSPAAGRPIADLRMPEDSLIVLISRNEAYLIPSGGTALEEGDTILVLITQHNLPVVRNILAGGEPAMDATES